MQLLVFCCFVASIASTNTATTSIVAEEAAVVELEKEAVKELEKKAVELEEREEVSEKGLL